MGISKFFKWMSQRYPCVLQLVEEKRIPQFDNLYLDMNGIIHHCSHPNEGDAHYRITEEQIFLAIFAYLEHLFALVKPQKLFFLAVDGVAPRAKMNQQRARRFKTAREMQELIDKAMRRGENLPKTTSFDSNCITPGTPFMALLSEQLKYFINKKVSEDSGWKDVTIILSGHDVPGEGEHKIMEYIRLSKAQKDYDANVRHCLYGLDADLIMLGLLSHDPHFCLLREEVKFTPKKTSSTKALEIQRFYLLHISLVREYLDWEFASLKNDINFPYDLERIIDDFILLCIFVGNDFLPHLPGLHINEGALGMIFKLYKKILPLAQGYLNEFGVLNTSRLQLMLNELSDYEREQFEHQCADSSWLQAKRSSNNRSTSSRSKKQLILSAQQRDLLHQVEHFVRQNVNSPLKFEAALSLPATYPAKDRKFLKDLASDLNLCIFFDDFNEDDEPIIVLAFDVDSSNSYDEDLDGVKNMLQDFEIAQDRNIPKSNMLPPKIEKALSKYNSAPMENEWNEEEFDQSEAKKFQEVFCKWKSEYYAEKMQLDFYDPKQLGQLAYTYIEGLQWVLHYYYSGVASWSWFYPYHYSPKISDLCNVASYQFNFDLDQPFKPFEQLMGVLPAASSAHVPPAYRELMFNSESPIIDFYPQDFQTDLNGKKHEWEAIVKIPFIDQNLLLKSMQACEHTLNEEERRRNQFGTSWQFQHDFKASITYPSSLPGFFPNLINCHSRMTKYDLPVLRGLRLNKGLCEGVLLGKDTIAGFPSFHNIPHSGELRLHGVKVHQSESKGESIIITIEDIHKGTKGEDLANALIGRQVYVGYPFLREAKVIALSDNLFRYDKDIMSSRCRSTPHSSYISTWKRTADQLEHDYSKTLGLLIGSVDIIVHVKPIKGLKRMDDGALIKNYEDGEMEYALQTIVLSVSSEDPRFLERNARPVLEDFPEQSKVFFLGGLHYGSPGQVVGYSQQKLTLRLMFFSTDRQENLSFKSLIKSANNLPYFSSYQVTKRLGIGAIALSKITSSFMVTDDEVGGQKVNIGLNLKFEAKSQKVIGMSRKGENGWEYSLKALELISEYHRLFPEICATIHSHPNRSIQNSRDFFGPGSAEKLTALKSWINEKGIRGFERVSLYADSLDRDCITSLQSLASQFSAGRIPENMKQAVIRNVPRNVLLKPAHAEERLHDQTFELGDRVTMVSDRGTVPISAKGTVVGVTEKFIEVVFDGPFIGGTDLSNRCQEYHGATVPPSTLLNLTFPQYTQSMGAQPPPANSFESKTRNQMGFRFHRGRGMKPALHPPQLLSQPHQSNHAQPPHPALRARRPHQWGQHVGTSKRVP
ncbi:hypothetical protein O181_004972 [Austropuccinia psidii MF-1]|uniref:5'-3' exoribonuclease 1 n=1 Tax=Austropuccinia psidii MF-1 TaxID=1389203 RepID=A0A9Q3BHW4_9BASI|nr:hypothetical protein [Austropuccinia psidii MF-1]